MNGDATNGRKPWLAVVLSLFCTGLGQLYCGRTARGLTLFLASLLFLPVVFLLALPSPSGAVLAAVLATLLVVPLLYLFSVVDAFRIARTLRGDYEPGPCNRVGLYVLFAIVGFLYPLGATAILRENVYEAFRVPAASMSPTIVPGDRVLVNKLQFRIREPARGDVVVFRYPVDRTKNYVKRIVGLPGDTIEMVEGRLRINGEEVERKELPGNEPAREETFGGRSFRVLPDSCEIPETRVPENCFFVLGDHRANSADSRFFGPVPRGDVLGPVQYVHLPAEGLSRMGRVR